MHTHITVHIRFNLFDSNNSVDILATEKQVKYLAYKLQEYAMVHTEYRSYEEKNSPEAVKECSDKWEEIFGSRIEDMPRDHMKKILDIFLPAPYGANRNARERLHKKLNKLSKD